MKIRLTNIIRNIRAKWTSIIFPPRTHSHAYEFIFRNSIKLSTRIKEARTNSLANTFLQAPSRATRLTDNLPVPSQADLKGSYSRNFRSSIPTYQKSLNLHILNRTLWTNDKAFKSGIRDSGECEKCGETEDTLHIFLECASYAEKIWLLFQKLVQLSGYPLFHVTPFIVLFLQDHSSIKSSHKEEIFTIVQEIKAKIYSERDSTRPLYPLVRVFAHLQRTLSRTIDLREYQLKSKGFIELMKQQLPALLDTI